MVPSARTCLSWAESGLVSWGPAVAGCVDDLGSRVAVTLSASRRKGLSVASDSWAMMTSPVMVMRLADWSKSMLRDQEKAVLPREPVGALGVGALSGARLTKRSWPGTGTMTCLR